VPHALRAARLALPLLVCAALLTPAWANAQDFGTQIVGGTNAEPGEYPWQIALLKKSGPSFGFICGGTLISDTQVLTAAHCTSGNASNFRVLVGTQQLNSGGTAIQVSSYEVHPDYDANTDQYDASLLQLAGSGTAAGGQPLQLIGEEGTADDALWSAGTSLAISGWGDTSEGGSISNQLREARAPRVADSTCGQSDYYGTAFDPGTMVCVGFPEGGVDTCQGDSGGPLVASTVNPLPATENNPAQWRLVGVTSWGIGCARAQKPGVYTRVAAPAIRNWILDSTPTTFALNLSIGGTGSGSVNLDPPDVNCTSGCSQMYASGTSVTLTASAGSNSTFAGWSGACSGTTPCTVTMSQARNVTATFNSNAAPPPPTSHSLTVTKTGDGGGTVTSSPAGINCGPTCSDAFPNGDSVTLTAVPSSGSTFGGWSGSGCSGTGTCTVTMSQARSVTAAFSTAPPPPPPPPPPPSSHTLTVGKSGAGSGTVTSSPSGIACGSTCAAAFTSGTSVTLSAAPASGSTFAGWSGACSGTGACTVTMDQARTVTAAFGVQLAPAFTPGLEGPLEELDDTPPVLELPAERVSATPRGVVRLPIDCAASPTGECVGVVLLRLRLPSTARAAALRTVGTASFDIAAGETKRVRLRLKRRARLLLRENGRLRLRIVVVFVDATGETHKLRDRVTVLAPPE
jgi:secreted trypsin-like serine protease